MKKCYYAHTMTSYNSIIEKQDIELLENLGFDVINPNTEEISSSFNKFREDNPEIDPMLYFQQIVENCDIIAFRSIPSGKILSGVAKELIAAQNKKIPIIELPCSLNSRMLSYPETKKYLFELGHYKI